MRCTSAVFRIPTTTGVGDLNGITSRLPYPRDLGIDTIEAESPKPAPVSFRERPIEVGQVAEVRIDRLVIADVVPEVATCGD